MTQPFTRQSQAERRQAFIEATIGCLAEFGYHGTTVRRIATAAGVTPGLLRHYYSGKDELIADAYRYGAEMTRSYALAAAEAAGARPQDQFKGFISATLKGPDLGVDLIRVWLNFWSTTLTEPAVRLAHQETYADYRASLATLIRNMAEDSDRSFSGTELAQLAIGVNSLIDGLWLERGLDPSTFDAEQAAEIIFRFTEAVLDISLA